MHSTYLGNYDVPSIINESSFAGFTPDIATIPESERTKAATSEMASSLRAGNGITCDFTASDVDDNWTRKLSLMCGKDGIETA